MANIIPVGVEPLFVLDEPDHLLRYCRLVTGVTFPDLYQKILLHSPQ
jgi:hypothetical protein